MDPDPSPRHAAPQPGPQPGPQPAPTRRWVLVGIGAVVVGGGTGVAARSVQRDAAPPQRRRDPPAELVTAAAAEEALIADLDATVGGGTDVRRVVTQLRADHAAHLATLRGLLAGYDTPNPSASTSSGPLAGTARTVAQLRAAEQRAAAAAARHARTLTGARAAVLASIAACEATHAELLS